MIDSYVITLKEQPWKRDITLPHFHRHGLNPKIVWGVSGFALALRPSNPYSIGVSGAPEYIHPVQVGCCLSHISALQMAVAIGTDEFIVFEDDAELCEGFEQKWPKFRESIPDDVGIVQLENMHSDKHYTKRINDHLSRCYYPFGSAAIWWRKKVAEEAINMIRPIDMPYDILLIRRVYPFFGHAIPNEKLVGQRSATGQWPSAVGDAMKTGLNVY